MKKILLILGVFALFVSGIIASMFILNSKQTTYFEGVCPKCEEKCNLETRFKEGMKQTEIWHCKHCNHTLNLVYYNGKLKRDGVILLESLKENYNGPSIDATDINNPIWKPAN